MSISHLLGCQSLLLKLSFQLGLDLFCFLLHTNLSRVRRLGLFPFNPVKKKLGLDLTSINKKQGISIQNGLPFSKGSYLPQF